MSSNEKKTVVVTGASTGIGEAIALRLDRQGMKVFAGVRSKEAGRQLADQASGDLEPLMLDVTNPDHIDESLRKVQEYLGDEGLFGLINNAGIGVGLPIECVGLDDLRFQLEVNIVGVVAVTQAFLPLIRKRKGRIIITGSTNGFLNYPCMGPYCMSKHAVEALGDCLSFEVQNLGVHVAVLQPGAILTPIWDKTIPEAKKMFEAVPEDLRGVYQPIVDKVLNFAEESSRVGSQPEVVAKDVLHALTSKRPKKRYLMGKNAYLERFISLLPRPLREAVMFRAFNF